ncbi:hypothetical protein A2738_01420 [Candidatus Nomurabacteria bacterium RIFCSPHIGHO2_01_FULL_42_15]|uniref:Uncharacterized protein n=1 Tax=Candidatus Nomurabacteria bacterium RIFCSPHIGHO2_01_FULL_42_15 TaxID=1801742 RepID=A0A1F6VFZ9_9BACT|nr:MAG: hypothetical protein A2738_01420 [Candidatus Nomurabacteria bacterium RIFCSPHIGHO2_01_FULL_42_15]OGI93051.1 MAG: hypothetical protein A3A99_00750 [Candidatus Nomurabacteria bacterium RIFCSPLOWO2_01_FULL_41_18]
MKKQYILALVGILIVIGISVYASKTAESPKPDDLVESNDEQGGTFEMIIDDGSPAITKEGRIVCLPHTNPDGPQTLECAFGFRTNDGVYYALDGGDMPDQISTTPMDQDVRIEGRFTAVEKLSSDFWQRYPIIGIITVTVIVEM